MTAIETAKLYFELSNKSDLEAVAKLFADTATYNSQTTGCHSGVSNIMLMQKEFHGKFSSLGWRVNSTKEIRPGTILFDYNFSGTLLDGGEINSSGLEYVTVHNGKIQNVEIKSKD